MLRRVLIGLIRVYQVAVSPWTPGACRYTPTCSTYAIEAVESHGAMRGGWLAVRRLLRCHPWGGWGHDPVPGRHEHRAVATADAGAEAGGSTTAPTA